MDLCPQNYPTTVCPELLTLFKRGKVIRCNSRSLLTIVNYRVPGLHRVERGLLNLLRRSRAILKRKIASQFNLETMRRPFKACSCALIVDDEEITIWPIDVTESHVDD